MDQAVVELLIDNIVSILVNEASLLSGVHDAIRNMKDELISMQSFLVDADRKGVGSEGEKTWVANVRVMADEAEDIIDEFMYHINSQQIQGGCSWILHHIIYFPKNLWVRHQTATKIQKINEKIKGEITERNKRYDIDHIKGTSSEYYHKLLVQRSELSFPSKEDKLVGIEKKRQVLMGWLKDGEGRTVISIVGMGGSGKTTLVANTFNNDDVKKHFDCCADITISQAYELEDLLRRMIKRFYKSRKEEEPTNLTSMNYTELVAMLVDYLKEKKYLLVLDDVWDTGILNPIMLILDDCHTGRIILTTRKENVASFNFEVTNHVYHIPPLAEDEAWDLFCKKAFSSNSNRYYPPDDLVLFAQKIVRKCEGLPLAIAAFGSLMYSKNKSQWTYICERLDWNLNNNPELEMVKNILLLSFNDLPHQLKHCFLYCSLFPKDYEIRRKRLIKLWMAEGFVKQVEGPTPEEVADNYLEELIFRSMLQVVHRNEFGRPKACKMHDLMREVSLPILEKQIFGVIHGGKGMENCNARRMSIHKTDVELKSFMGMSKLRSFLVFNNCKTIPFGSKMLRALDLQDVPIDELPDEVVNFFNLKYLNLRKTSLKRLPNSIGRLLNLQTLDIRDTKIEALPRGIGNLQNLRHLIMYRYTQNWHDFRYLNGTQVPSNISRLTNLQSVSAIESNGDLMQQIRSMTQLTRIGISNVKEADERDLCDSIQNMKLLHYLFIMATNEEENLRMDALSAAPPKLRLLILVGKLEKVPQWFRSLQSLTDLFLHWSRLEEDILRDIAALPHLRRLTLTKAYVGKQLCFSTGFLKLKALGIRNFPQLREIIIKKGVMPNLEYLDIVKCMELKTVPKGIEYLQNLHHLYLESVSMELQNCIRCVDFPKVQHFPKIYIR